MEEGLICNLLERGGKVGRGEEKWGDICRTRSGQQTASTAQTTAGGMQTLSCHGNRTRQLIQTEANHKEIKTN